jgi:hypothetical protein
MQNVHDVNPYAQTTVAAHAPAAERVGFLKKVYGILLLGVLGFAATLWAAGNVPAVNAVALEIGSLIYRGRYGWLIYIGIFMAGSWAVHALAEKRPINAVAYAAWVVLLALLIAPLVLMIAKTRGVEVINQASMLTAVVFGGLTAVVLYTGKDFSFLRGILGLVGIVLFGACIAGLIFGFTMGLWMSVAIVALFAGYILYDTSEILHRLPTNMAMSGAIMLFTDVVLLFKHILILLASRRD